MWIPGVLSPETVRWCAAHRYPYIGLGTRSAPRDLWDIYAEEAQKHGYQAGSENFGYLIPTFVAETEARAQELGKGFMFGGGQNAFSRPEHTLPRAIIPRLLSNGSPNSPVAVVGVNRAKLIAQSGKISTASTMTWCGRNSTPGTSACSRISRSLLALRKQ